MGSTPAKRGLYATPIIYPITFIADRNPWAAKLVMMNPLSKLFKTYDTS